MRRPNYRTDQTRRTASPPLSPRSTAPARTVSIGTSTADDIMITDAELPLDPGTNGRTPLATLHWDLRSYLDAEDPVAPAPRAGPARRRRPTDFEAAGTASTARVVPPMARRRRQPPMVPEWMLDPVTWMEEEEFAKKSWPEARNMSVEEVAEYNRKALKEDREENEKLSKPKSGNWYLPGSFEFFHDM